MKTMNSGGRELLLAGMACAVLLAGCARREELPPPPVAKKARPASTHATGWRTEPVIYNGRRYAVSFRQTGRHTRLVKVSAPGRKLGATKGDGRIIAEVATSTVHHYTCRDSQRASLRPGSLRPRNGQWRMTVVCR